MGLIFVIMLGLLPAVMLRQGVTKGRPARILVWVFSIGSQAIVCILFLIVPGFWGRNVPATIGHNRTIGQLQAEILFPCLAFTIAAVVSLVLVSTELAVKKDEFLKVVRSNEEPEGGVIEEVVVSSPKSNEEGASLRCPKCGTNAGCEAYYNNSDNICYMTYCTKCVHEHGLYVRLETDEEEISQKEKNYLEIQKLKKEREASKIKEKCKDFVEFSLDESDGSWANDFNPVSRVLKGRSHYEVLGVEKGSTEEEIRVAFRQLALAVHPDKNRDPRAGEAFAKVQQAFSGLSKEA
jgi:hypothetical protein